MYDGLFYLNNSRWLKGEEGRFNRNVEFLKREGYLPFQTLRDQPQGLPEDNLHLAIPTGDWQYDILDIEPTGVREHDIGMEIDRSSRITFVKFEKGGKTNLFSTTAQEIGIELFIPTFAYEHIMIGSGRIHGRPISGYRLRFGELPPKNVLSDEVFRNTDPDSYLRIYNKIQKDKVDLEHIATMLYQTFPTAKITTRQKSIGSIQSRLERFNGRFKINQIYDSNGARLIFNTPMECYRAFWLATGPQILERYSFFPAFTFDRILLPSANGYQSIHIRGWYHDKPLEIQIRTHRMHETAERGQAANYRRRVS